MKTLRKCFSLVELIVVLTIMAILAVLCAPNISAYISAVKIQNYQTALNNLVDEVQTQLPQGRYWNWEEVQENAKAILQSDSARGVTVISESDTECVY
ncbi:MAG: prepilin-type N-terminal cleavage/methylation domain-containing protein [Ruminococcus sp.]|nr:prepilin-type N-terminal cleavage/methylation domain-containing protein [Ruminococcus sp.]